MADDDKKNKDGDDKGKNKDDGSKKMTWEEIQEVANRAAAAVAKKDDDDKGDDGDDKDDKKKKGDDADLDVDPKTLDSDKTLAYIDKLKDENAKRRIAAKKATQDAEKKGAELQKAADALKAATEKIKEYDDKTDAEKAKERTDLENALKKIEDLQGELKNLNDKVSESETQLAKTRRKVAKQDRAVMIDRLVKENEYNFASNYERDGLIASLSDMDAGDFEKDDEEVIMDVMKFLKKAKEGTPKNTPGAGPPNRSTSTPLAEEVKALLAKKELTVDDKKRLDELTDLAGQKR